MSGSQAPQIKNWSTIIRKSLKRGELFITGWRQHRKRAAAGASVVWPFAACFRASSDYRPREPGRECRDRSEIHRMAGNRRTWDSIDEMRKAADEGDAQAQCYLGVCYQTGQGMPLD